MRQAVLLGDHRPFIAALIVPERKKIAAELKKQEASLTEREIEALIQSRIEQINLRLETVERIRRIAVMAEDFPDDVRSVSAFQKIKVDRIAVQARYQEQISAIYPSPERGAA